MIYLKNPSQFGVTVWNMGFISFCKSCNDISKSRKGFVDVFSLVQKCSLKIIYIIQAFLEIFSNGGMDKKTYGHIWAPPTYSGVPNISVGLNKRVNGIFFVYQVKKNFLKQNKSGTLIFATLEQIDIELKTSDLQHKQYTHIF